MQPGSQPLTNRHRIFHPQPSRRAQTIPAQPKYKNIKNCRQNEREAFKQVTPQQALELLRRRLIG